MGLGVAPVYPGVPVPAGCPGAVPRGGGLCRWERVCWGRWGMSGGLCRAWVHLGEGRLWGCGGQGVFYGGFRCPALWGDCRRGWYGHQDEFGDTLGWEERGGRGAEGCSVQRESQTRTWYFGGGEDHFQGDCCALGGS